MRIHTVFPAEFPEPWASDWGEDEFGLFMGFIYKGVKQDFRWIEPGIFLMGSPENELHRFENEVQHEVTLPKGFWLANTTVTQALWEAVMGENPSLFKDANRPVENVSWDNVQTFINKMNSLKTELRLCLPTESQWEYACRAGTTTRYAFGDELTKEQANFNASETVEVASYSPNGWGLYDMHGNLWEWCLDQQRDIWVGLLDGRGCRGGAWNSDAREMRCAVTYGVEHDKRSNEVGFRLARSL